MPARREPWNLNTTYYNMDTNLNATLLKELLESSNCVSTSDLEENLSSQKENVENFIKLILAYEEEEKDIESIDSLTSEEFILEKLMKGLINFDLGTLKSTHKKSSKKPKSGKVKYNECFSDLKRNKTIKVPKGINKRIADESLFLPQSGSLLNFSVDHNVKFPIVDKVMDYFTGNDKPKPKNIFTANPESVYSVMKATLQTSKNICSEATARTGDMFGAIKDTALWHFLTHLLDTYADWGILVLMLLWMVFAEALHIKAKGTEKTRKVMRTLGSVTMILIIVKIVSQTTKSKIWTDELASWMRVAANLQSALASLSVPQGFYRGEDGILVPLNMENWGTDEGFNEEPLPPLEPQGASDVISPMAELILIICNTTIGLKTKAPLANAIIGFTKTTELQRTNLIDMVTTMCENFSRFMEDLVGPNTISQYFHVDTIDPFKVAPLLEEIKVFCAESNSGIDLIDPNRCVRYAELENKSRILLKELEQKSYDYKVLLQGVLELKKREITIEGFNKSLNGDRVEPVGILLMGEPSVKKAVLMDRICKHVSYATIPEPWKEDFTKDPDSYKYVIPDDKFFDGYKYKHWFAVKDDLFQKREKVGSELPDSLLVIKTINSASFCLPMAKASEKNSMYYRSPFFGGSTNFKPTHFNLLEAVHDSSAVARRFTVAVNISINPKYASSRGSAKGLPVESLRFNLEEKVCGTVIPDDYWEIELLEYDLLNKTFNSKGSINYHDLIFRIIDQYKTNVGHYYMNKQSSIDSFIRMKKKLDEKYNNNYQAAGSWFLKDDPVQKAINSEIDKLKQISCNDFVFPQSGYLSDIEDDISDDQVQGKYESSSKTEWHDPNDDEATLDNKKLLKAARLYDVTYSFLKTIDPGEVWFLLRNSDYGYGFNHERSLRFRTPMFYATDDFIKIMTNPKDIPSSVKDKTIFLKGAKLCLKYIQETHPLPIQWFKEDKKFQNMNPILAWNGSRMLYDMVFLSEDANAIKESYSTSWISLVTQYDVGILHRSSPHQVFNLFIESLNLKERKEILTSICNIVKFAKLIGDIMNDRFNHGKNAITGKEEFPSWTDPIAITKYALKKIRSAFCHVFTFLKEHGLMLTLFLTVGTTLIYALYKFLSTITSFLFPQSVDFSNETSHEPDIVPKKSEKKKEFTKKVRTFNLSQISKDIPANFPQGDFIYDGAFSRLPIIIQEDFGMKGGINDIVSATINNSYYIIYVTRKLHDGTITERYGHCTNIKGRYFWHPFHFIHMFQELVINKKKYLGATISLIRPNKSNSYVITMEDFLNNFNTTEYGIDSDQSLIYVRKAQPTSAGVFKYLLKESDWSMLKKNTAMDILMVGSRISQKYDIDNITLSQKYLRCTFNEETPIVASWEKQDADYWKTYKLIRSMNYDGSFNTGDCGSLIFSRSGNFQNRCIAGMHVAGGSGTGVGTIVSQEMMQDMLNQFNDHFGIFEEEELPPPEIKHLSIPHGNIMSAGMITGSLKWNSPSTSKIRKSLLYGKVGNTYGDKKKPAIMHPFYKEDTGELIDPMLKAVSNYGLRPPCIDDDVLREASQSYRDLVLKETENYLQERRALTLLESLHGFGSLKSISSSTSSGFPLNLPGIMDIKKEYFKAYNEKSFDISDKIYEEIKREFERYQNMYNQNKRPFWLFIDFLKDELRKVEKVQNGDTRMISGAPFYLMIFFRMYFGTFMDAFFESNYKIGSAIGLNPYSENWDMVARRLKQFGKSDGINKVLAGDHSKFDAHLNTGIMNEVLNIINEWYNDLGSHNHKMRCFLWAEITNSKHHCNNELMIWFFSMPSGNPMTALINTMSNNIIIRACWIEADLHIMSFNSKAYVIALGDDIAIAVSQDVEEYFNEFTLPDLMKRIGFDYTLETKGSALTAFRDLSEVEFLKRKWVYSKQAGRYIAPLRLESIFSMLEWTKKDVRANQITVDNIATAIRELSLHGRDFFNEHSRTFINLKRKYLSHYSFKGKVELDFDYALKQTLNHDFSW